MSTPKQRPPIQQLWSAITTLCDSDQGRQPQIEIREHEEVDNGVKDRCRSLKKLKIQTDAPRVGRNLAQDLSPIG